MALFWPPLQDDNHNFAIDYETIFMCRMSKG